MPRSNLISLAFRDLIDDVTYHVVGLAHGAFDLVCLLALGSVIYVSSIDTADAGLGVRPMFGIQASMDGSLGASVSSSHAPSSCALTNDLLASDHRSCITAMLLVPVGI